MILITNKCTERLHLARDIYWFRHSISLWRIFHCGLCALSLFFSVTFTFSVRFSIYVESVSCPATKLDSVWKIFNKIQLIFGIYFK